MGLRRIGRRRQHRRVPVRGDAGQLSAQRAAASRHRQPLLPPVPGAGETEPFRAAVAPRRRVKRRMPSRLLRVRLRASRSNASSLAIRSRNRPLHKPESVSGFTYG